MNFLDIYLTYIEQERPQVIVAEGPWGLAQFTQRHTQELPDYRFYGLDHLEDWVEVMRELPVIQANQKALFRTPRQFLFETSLLHGGEEQGAYLVEAYTKSQAIVALEKAIEGEGGYSIDELHIEFIGEREDIERAHRIGKDVWRGEDYEPLFDTRTVNDEPARLDRKVA